MHRIFVTDGIVLGKRALGEAHSLVSVLTKEQGLLRAKATSTRSERSKLRFGIEPMTSARFSFVQGKYEWKLTGVERISRELVSLHMRNRVAAGRIAKLLLRLVRGEDEGRALFATVSEGLPLLSVAENAEMSASIECILVLRILSHLGYLPEVPALTPFVEGDFSSAELAIRAQTSRAFLIRMINESLAQTGL